MTAAYPERIILRAPIWQRLFLPAVVAFAIYCVATDSSLQMTGSYTTGAIIALTVLSLFEVFFLARFFLDGTLMMDPEGVSFTRLGKKHYYKWNEIESIYCMNAEGFFVYINGLCLTRKKIVMFMEHYGFFDGEKLGNLLESYHKAALEAQEIEKQE